MIDAAWAENFLKLYGFPIVAFLVLSFLFWQQQRNHAKQTEVDLKEKESELEDTKVNFAKEQTVQIMAKAFERMETAMIGNTSAIKASTEASNANAEAAKQIAAGVLGLNKDIESVEQNINTHTSSEIDPFRAIHAGHTEKLLFIQATLQDHLAQILAAINGIKGLIEPSQDHIEISEETRSIARKQLISLEAIQGAIKKMVDGMEVEAEAEPSGNEIVPIPETAETSLSAA